MSGPKRWPNDFEHLSGGVTVIFIRSKRGLHECFVWTEDFLKVHPYRWRASLDGGIFYAYTHVGATDNLAMHRLLLPGAEFVDHKNHNGLDNRIFKPEIDDGNIRPATRSQNIANSRRKNLYGKGIKKQKNGRYTARIVLGTYDTVDAACQAYQEAAEKVYGEFACFERKKSI